jgi:hypothetical protein
MAGNSDDTVILAPRKPRRRPWLAGALLAAVVLIAAGGTAAWLYRPAQPAAPASLIAPPPAARPAAGESTVSGTEAQIDADNPATLTVFRFAPNPRILVMDFPTLAEQGRMLNRVAALVEKDGAPHDRLLSDTELDALIRRSGATSDTFYYGHDYSASALTHFFALADRDEVRLNADEQRLRRLIAQWTAEPFGFGALITLVRADAANDVDAASRTTILHHELSHGEYFTNAIYAGYVDSFWRDVLTEGERAQFRRYLGREGYDMALEDLMMNETQAYLMHTPDRRFFDPAQLAIAPVRLAALRATFSGQMPSCWLRDETPGAPGVARVSAPRRRQRPETVSRRITLAARLPPRRRRLSIAA